MSIKDTLKSSWKVGFLTLLPVLIILMMLSWVYDYLGKIKIDFVESDILNFLIKLAILILAPLIFGLPLKIKWFKNLVVELVSNIPLVGGFIVSGISNQKGQVNVIGREVFFKETENTWGLGILSNEFFWDSRGDGVIEKFGFVTHATSPVPITGICKIVPFKDIVLTGRNVQATFVTTSSFGVNFPIDPLKFTKLSNE